MTARLTLVAAADDAHPDVRAGQRNIARFDAIVRAWDATFVGREAARRAHEGDAPETAYRFSVTHLRDVALRKLARWRRTGLDIDARAFLNHTARALRKARRDMGSRPS